MIYTSSGVCGLLDHSEELKCNPIQHMSTEIPAPTLTLKERERVLSSFTSDLCSPRCVSVLFVLFLLNNSKSHLFKRFSSLSGISAHLISPFNKPFFSLPLDFPVLHHLLVSQLWRRSTTFSEQWCTDTRIHFWRRGDAEARGGRPDTSTLVSGKGSRGVRAKETKRKTAAC